MDVANQVYMIESPVIRERAVRLGTTHVLDAPWELPFGCRSLSPGFSIVAKAYAEGLRRMLNYTWREEPPVAAPSVAAPSAPPTADIYSTRAMVAAEHRGRHWVEALLRLYKSDDDIECIRTLWKLTHADVLHETLLAEGRTEEASAFEEWVTAFFEHEPPADDAGLMTLENF